MDKLTDDEIADMAERGRIFYLASKGKLEPKDYAAYYYYKREEQDRRIAMYESSPNSSTTYDSSNDQNSMSNSSNLSLSSEDESSSVIGKYTRKQAYIDMPSLANVSSISDWSEYVVNWVEKKVEKISRSHLLFKIRSMCCHEYQPDASPDHFSEELHELIYTLFFRGKRVCRIKGSKHKTPSVIADVRKMEEESRREFINILNETTKFFEQSSPTSTSNYKEKMQILLKVIVEKLFYDCRPITNFDDILGRELKEAHKNSSAAFRRFARTSENFGVKRDISSLQFNAPGTLFLCGDQSNHSSMEGLSHISDQQHPVLSSRGLHLEVDDSAGLIRKSSKTHMLSSPSSASVPPSLSISSSTTSNSSVSQSLASNGNGVNMRIPSPTRNMHPSHSHTHSHPHLMNPSSSSNNNSNHNNNNNNNGINVSNHSDLIGKKVVPNGNPASSPYVMMSHNNIGDGYRSNNASNGYGTLSTTSLIINEDPFSSSGSPSPSSSSNSHHLVHNQLHNPHVGGPSHLGNHNRLAHLSVSSSSPSSSSSSPSPSPSSSSSSSSSSSQSSSLSSSLPVSGPSLASSPSQVSSSSLVSSSNSLASASSASLSSSNDPAFDPMSPYNSSSLLNSYESMDPILDVDDDVVGVVVDDDEDEDDDDGDADESESDNHLIVGRLNGQRNGDTRNMKCDDRHHSRDNHLASSLIGSQANSNRNDNRRIDTNNRAIEIEQDTCLVDINDNYASSSNHNSNNNSSSSSSSSVDSSDMSNNASDSDIKRDSSLENNSQILDLMTPLTIDHSDSGSHNNNMLFIVD